MTYQSRLTMFVEDKEVPKQTTFHDFVEYKALVDFIVKHKEPEKDSNDIKE